MDIVIGLLFLSVWLFAIAACTSVGWHIPGVRVVLYHASEFQRLWGLYG